MSKKESAVVLPKIADVTHLLKRLKKMRKKVLAVVAPKNSRCSSKTLDRMRIRRLAAQGV